MVVTTVVESQVTTLSPPRGEQRVALSGITWQAYEQILAALPESRGAKLTYDNGLLEITMPLEDHEFAGRLIERFIITLVELYGLDMKTMGSTTLKYPEMAKGGEPDNAYYIQNQHLLAGRNVDLTVDPPPDLVVEVDITHTDIEKEQFYARLGVTEFWRFNGRIWRIYVLAEAGAYIEVETSPTFPQTNKAQLYNFLKAAKTSEMKAVQQFKQEWQAEN
jgi:Uma2 family endonuclease